MKLRKGDAPKAVALAIAIVAVLAFVVRSFLAATGGGPGAVRPAAKIPGRPAEAKPVAEQMYAERPRRPASDLASAKRAPNPFLPAIAAREAPKAAAASKKASPPPPLPELPNLRLVGIVAGPSGTTVVLVDGNRRYYLRRGQLAPRGWSVAQIGSRSVVLVKGGQRATLLLEESSGG